MAQTTLGNCYLAVGAAVSPFVGVDGAASPLNNGRILSDTQGIGGSWWYVCLSPPAACSFQLQQPVRHTIGAKAHKVQGPHSNTLQGPGGAVG